MTPRRQNAAATTAKQYFYSPNLDDCPGCGKRKRKMRGTGAVELTAVGRPILVYALCTDCAPIMARGDVQFARELEQRLIARAEALGAFGSVGRTI